ncbi:MAG: hypothetical protein ACLGIS_17205, partial [Actinomycetes bacterium]
LAGGLRLVPVERGWGLALDTSDPATAARRVAIADDLYRARFEVFAASVFHPVKLAADAMLDLVLRRLGTPVLLSGAVSGVLFIGQAYTQSMLYLVHVDTLCVALGFASAWLTHGALADARPRLLPWAALCAALAPWTKQLGVAVPLAVLLWLWWTGRRDLAGRFFFWCVVWGGVTGMLFFAVFGAENLAFNLWLIHARTPFRGGWTLLLPETGRLLLENWVWLAAFAAAWIFPTARESVPRTSLAALLWFLALAHLPLGISAVLKEGGGWNSLHAQYYLLPLLAGLLVRVAALPRGRLLLAAIFLASFMQAACSCTGRARSGLPTAGRRISSPRRVHRQAGCISPGTPCSPSSPSAASIPSTTRFSASRRQVWNPAMKRSVPRCRRRRCRHSNAPWHSGRTTTRGHSPRSSAPSTSPWCCWGRRPSR